MVYAQSKICPREDNHKILFDFEVQTDHLIRVSKLDLEIVNKKRTTFQIVDHIVLSDHRVKIKEYEKRDRYLYLAMEQKYMEHESDGLKNCNWFDRKDT